MKIILCCVTSDLSDNLTEIAPDFLIIKTRILPTLCVCEKLTCIGTKSLSNNGKAISKLSFSADNLPVQGIN